VEVQLDVSGESSTAFFRNSTAWSYFFILK